MESKIQIDIDVHRQEHINILWTPTEDVRDKLLAMFLQTACPGDGVPCQPTNVLDGYCRISIISYTEAGGKKGIRAEIVPIHPMDAPKYIDQIKENAEKFKLA